MSGPAIATLRDEVLALNSAGMPYRKIAAKLGIGYGTVTRLVNDAVKQTEPMTRRTTLLVAIRCPGCRAKVKELPCLYCQLCRARDAK